MPPSASSYFDRTTTISESAPGRFDADLDAGWTVGGGLNGGYLLATIAAAVRSAVDRPDPLAISAYYLAASTPGPARIDVEVLRSGGRTATAAARLTQRGPDGASSQARIAALASFGDLAAAATDVRTTALEPRLPDPEVCVANRQPGAPPLLERYDLRFAPDDAGWLEGRPSGRASLSAWFRLSDGREPDPLALLLVVDALPPALFGLGVFGWAPTVELTAHVRARPAPGWLKVRHESRNIADGCFEEDCEVWDAAGRLVAQSRQLARLPR